MKSKRFLGMMGLLLIISIVIYGLQIITFHNSHDTFFYLFQDLAFLPVTIIITIFIVGTLLDEESKKKRIEASRILSNSFFSIIGNPLMEHLCAVLDDDIHIRWDDEEFRKILHVLDTNTDTILTIASNPNLLEHAKFTDLLWAVLHLREELYSRKDEQISLEDGWHIAMDAQRVFDLYLENWGDYCEYIRAEYPYYFMSEGFIHWKSQATELSQHNNRE